MKTHLPRFLLLAGFLTVSAFAAFEVGTFAYTKRLETNLLAEPKPTAESTGKIAFAHKVKVDEIKGPWLRVSEGAVAGWVFAANLSDAKPNENARLDGVALLASKTTATAAARPLDEAVVKYAEQRDLQSAGEDLQWMLTASDAITDDEVTAYLQENKKGEYQ
jgi:hypothetical protein